MEETADSWYPHSHSADCIIWEVSYMIETILHSLATTTHLAWHHSSGCNTILFHDMDDFELLTERIFPPYHIFVYFYVDATRRCCHVDDSTWVTAVTSRHTCTTFHLIFVLVLLLDLDCNNYHCMSLNHVLGISWSETLKSTSAFAVFQSLQTPMIASSLDVGCGFDFLK